MDGRLCEYQRRGVSESAICVSDFGGLNSRLWQHHEGLLGVSEPTILVLELAPLTVNDFSGLNGRLWQHQQGLLGVSKSTIQFRSSPTDCQSIIWTEQSTLGVPAEQLTMNISA